MTRFSDGIIGLNALNSGGGDLMKLDPFDGALWKKKLSDPDADGTVTVTLSTGKKVTVNSRLLALLRVLADELAREEAGLH
ncbi:MAG: hypothetical protein ACK4NP_12090 [Parvularculaceae bacterium]